MEPLLCITKCRWLCYTCYIFDYYCKNNPQGSSETHISVYTGSWSLLCFCVHLASMSCSGKSVYRLASGQHCVKGSLKMLIVHIQGLIKCCPLSLYVSVTNTLQEQPKISAILLLSFQFKRELSSFANLKTLQSLRGIWLTSCSFLFLVHIIFYTWITETGSDRLSPRWNDFLGEFGENGAVYW